MKIVLFSVFLVFLYCTILAQVPTFQWAKHIGGTAGTYGQSMAVGATGNIYITGYFRNTTDFDPGPVVYGLTASSPNGDLFLVKLDPNGEFIWAKNISTNQSLDPSMGDGGYSISLDKNDNAYLTGSFRLTTDFDPSSGVSNLTSKGGLDVFILKLSSAGNFIWVKQIGGFFNDKGVSITINTQNQVIAAGSFQDTVDFNPDIGISNLISGGSNDAFIIKLDAIGNFIWVKQYGNSASGYAQVNSVTTDSIGNVFSTGSFFGSADFDTGLGVFTLSNTADVFISKLDSLGDFLWAVGFGGGSYDDGKSIKIDYLGNVYATGYFTGSVDFDPSTTTTFTLSSPNPCAFIIKLDPLGNFHWAKNMGLNSDARGYDISLDLQGNVYATGQFIGISNFDPSASNFTLSSNGIRDIFISKLDFSGNFVWAKSIGSSADDVGRSINVDGQNNIYTIGWYKSMADFDPSVGMFNMPIAGYCDMFIHKMSQPTVGIEENSYLNNIVIYPNPVNGIVNIEVGYEVNTKTYFEILNVFGQIIITKPIFNQHTSFNIEQLKSGLYTVKIICNDKAVVTKKILKN